MENDAYGVRLDIGDKVASVFKYVGSPKIRKGEIVAKVSGKEKNTRIQKFLVSWTYPENFIEKYCPQDSLVLGEQLLKI